MGTLSGRSNRPPRALQTEREKIPYKSFYAGVVVSIGFGCSLTPNHLELLDWEDEIALEPLSYDAIHFSQGAAGERNRHSLTKRLENQNTKIYLIDINLSLKSKP